MEALPSEISASGLKGVQLGDKRGAVRARLGRFDVFRRTPDAPETDYFVERGVQVTYDDAGRVVFIEVTVPADPVLNGVRLLQRAIADVVADLRERGIECVEDRDGAYVPAWRVGLFAIGGVVEGVAIGE